MSTQPASLFTVMLLLLARCAAYAALAPLQIALSLTHTRVQCTLITEQHVDKLIMLMGPRQHLKHFLSLFLGLLWHSARMKARKEGCDLRTQKLG